MTLRSSWLAATGQTREDTRLTQTGATTPASHRQVRSGILPGSSDGKYRVSGFWMNGTTGTMAATVYEGRAVIQGSTAQGAYPVALTEPATLTFADGDATNNRIDLVVLRIYDSQYDQGSTLTQASLEIVKGTPAATPVAPAASGAALPIYQVTVRAGVSTGKGGINWSTDVTDVRSSVVAAGGILPVYGETGNGAYPGQYRDSSVGLQRWTGSAWVTYQAAPTWTDYTPVWRTETGTAPSVGFGTLAGSYLKMGTLVHVRIYLKMGLWTNLWAQDADGNWTFSLPVAPVSSPAWKLDSRVLSAEAYDASANLLYQGSGLLSTANGGVVRSLRDPLKTPIWDKSAPFTWNTDDVLSIHGTYESAS